MEETSLPPPSLPSLHLSPTESPVSVETISILLSQVSYQ